MCVKTARDTDIFRKKKKIKLLIQHQVSKLFGLVRMLIFLSGGVIVYTHILKLCACIWGGWMGMEVEACELRTETGLGVTSPGVE